MLKVSWTICNIQKKNPEVRDVVEIQRPFLCEKSRGIFAWDAGGQERRTVMGFLIREGARLVVRLPQEVDHHKTESIRIQVDQMIRKEPVTEVEFDFSRTMFMDSAGVGLLIGRSQMMEALGGKVIISHMSRRIQRVLELSGIEQYISLDKEEDR